MTPPADRSRLPRAVARRRAGLVTGALRPGPTVLTVSLALALALAPALARPLDEFLAAAGESVAVVTAELERADAARALERIGADPLALRLDLVGARQRLELAEAAEEEARLEARRDVAAAWARLREAELQVDLAEAARDLAGRSLEVARLRSERGSATVLDVQAASTDLLEAERNLQMARDGAALARADLEGVTGVAVEGRLELDRARLDGLVVPEADELAEAVLRSPAMLRARHAVELAEVAASLLDPSFASRSQIESAALQRDQALAGEREARRSVLLRARSLATTLASAQEGDRIAREALAQAREREEVERRRLEAGLIAEIAFDAVRLETRRAELAAAQAEHALIDAALILQAAALWPLEGWHEP